MGNFSKLAALVGGIAAILSFVTAIPKVSRAGRYLYTDDGSRFYIKGVVYQELGDVVVDPNNPLGEPSTYIDPLANSAACARDIPLLQQLGVNTIRVYNVDASINHNACMQALSAAGIYVIIDLSLPVNGSINRLAPSWTTNLLNLYISTIDAFSPYDNVLAYNIGNEVAVNVAGTEAAPYVKAAARDVKAYLRYKSSSALVGYAAIDGEAAWITPFANYLSCEAPGSDPSGATAIDLYGLNSYSWCKAPTFEGAYGVNHGNFAGYNVPAYFSEFGCPDGSNSTPWSEVSVLFSSQMSDVFSGGLAFSYFHAVSPDGEFGMVTVSGSTATPNASFNALVAAYGNVMPPAMPSRATAGSTRYPACPSANSTFRASSTLPPTPNNNACQCLESHLSCNFSPSINNAIVIGPLLDTACGLLEQRGGSCSDIGGNGTTGVYGRVSACDPTVKLSFVFSEYYESSNRNPAACSFAGNGTVNHSAPSSVSAANAAASSCLSDPSATFAPTGIAGPHISGSGTSRPTSTRRSRSTAMSMDANALLRVGAMAIVGVVSCLWILTSPF